MILQLVKPFLTLLFFIFWLMGSPVEADPQCYSVIQTPTSLNVMEGSALSMECRIEGNITSKWSFDWHNNKSDGRVKLQNSKRTHILTNRDEKFSHFTLQKAVLDDSGTYLCSVVSVGLPHVSSNGTQVIISEITNWMVNQTPGHVEKVEGANVTIECRFRTGSNSSTMYVKWRKEGLEEELTNKTGSCTIAQDLEKGFASLTLMDAHMADSGSYRCTVGSRSRNQTGSGNGSHVVITAAKLLVHQTPALINGTEGEELTIRCSFAVKRQYNVTWYKDGAEVTKALLISTEGLASLILKKVKMEDSGTYTCGFGHHGQGNGTRVKILAAQLLVHQTPALINGMEGEELTIRCSFQEPKAPYSVTWYKDGAEVTKGSLLATKGLASLILRKITMEDSGTYICDFGHHGQGNGTRVKVLAQDKQLGMTISTDVGVGVGVGVGILILLLLISAFVWRWKRRTKVTSVGTTNAESIPAKDLRKKHPPLTNQASEVMYASLNFNQKEMQSTAGEVIYAEVRIASKQRGGNGCQT